METKEAVNARVKKYYASHKTERLQYQKKYNEQNREIIRQKQHEYYQANKEVINNRANANRKKYYGRYAAKAADYRRTFMEKMSTYISPISCPKCGSYGYLSYRTMYNTKTKCQHATYKVVQHRAMMDGQDVYVGCCTLGKVE